MALKKAEEQATKKLAAKQAAEEKKQQQAEAKQKRQEDAKRMKVEAMEGTESAKRTITDAAGAKSSPRGHAERSGNTTPCTPPTFRRTFVRPLLPNLKADRLASTSFQVRSGVHRRPDAAHPARLLRVLRLNAQQSHRHLLKTHHPNARASICP